VPVVALLVAACQKPAPEVPVPVTTVEAVAARVGQADFFLFDANPKDFYDRGHIRGATWVPFNHLEREALPSSHDAQLVFYCANELCTASHDAARAAASLGYSNVAVMSAGYFGWKRAGHPVVEATN
jgi:rhodanese-related sulfurtransferase